MQVSTVADINDLEAVPSPDAMSALPNTDLSDSSVVRPGSSAMAPMVRDFSVRAIAHPSRLLHASLAFYWPS